MRPEILAKCRTTSIVTTAVANKASLTACSILVKAIAISRPCNTNIRIQFAALLSRTWVVSPTMAQDEMPTKAAR